MQINLLADTAHNLPRWVRGGTESRTHLEESPKVSAGSESSSDCKDIHNHDDGEHTPRDDDARRRRVHGESQREARRAEVDESTNQNTPTRQEAHDDDHGVRPRDEQWVASGRELPSHSVAAIASTGDGAAAHLRRQFWRHVTVDTESKSASTVPRGGSFRRERE